MTHSSPARSNLDRSWLIERALLISIRPRFARAILDGAKTVELRRTRPALNSGASVLLYASTPIKAVVGYADIIEVIEAHPSLFWSEHRDATAISGLDFDRYFEGSDIAVGLRLHRVVKAPSPIPLRSLRRLGIEPPQSWRYLDPELANQMRLTLTGSSGPANGVVSSQADWGLDVWREAGDLTLLI